MIRALIFDFDGLILDTEGPEFQSWQELYSAHGCALELETYAVAIGTANAFDAWAELERQLGRTIDRETLRPRHRQRNAELIECQAVRPGVEDYLRDARRLGLKVGVASSSPRSWVAGHLERLGLIEQFDCIKCADDVRVVKPDPEIYLAAVDALGVTPGDAIAIEDSPNGLLAARRAGLFAVVIPNPTTRQLSFDQADLRIESLADLPLEKLISLAQLR